MILTLQTSRSWKRFYVKHAGMGGTLWGSSSSCEQRANSPTLRYCKYQIYQNTKNGL